MIRQDTYAVPREDLREALSEFDPSLEGYVAQEALPIKTVKRKAATLSVIIRENLKRTDARHSNGGSYGRVNLVTEDLAYACKSYGLEEQLTDDDRANFDNDFDAELEVTLDVQRKLLLEQEIRIAALLLNTTTWTGAALYKDWSAAPWDTVGSACITHVAYAKEIVRKNTGYKADSILMGEATLNNLLQMTDIKARFPGATLVTEEMLRANIAAIFGLKNLIVGGRIYDSALEGQTFSGGDIWGDDYCLIFKRSEGSAKSGGLGRILLWDEITPDNLTVDTYREPQTKSDIIRVEHYLDEKVFDAYFGCLIKVDA